VCSKTAACAPRYLVQPDWLSPDWFQVWESGQSLWLCTDCLSAGPAAAQQQLPGQAAVAVHPSLQPLALLESNSLTELVIIKIKALESSLKNCEAYFKKSGFPV